MRVIAADPVNVVSDDLRCRCWSEWPVGARVLLGRAVEPTVGWPVASSWHGCWGPRESFGFASAAILLVRTCTGAGPWIGAERVQPGTAVHRAAQRSTLAVVVVVEHECVGGGVPDLSGVASEHSAGLAADHAAAFVIGRC
jgi:hypothetical protein